MVCVCLYYLVLCDKELGGQERVIRRVQVARSALVGDHEESDITDDIQLL